MQKQRLHQDIFLYVPYAWLRNGTKTDQTAYTQISLFYYPIYYIILPGVHF